MKANLETWHQDPFDPDCWFGENGLLINTAALDERSVFFEVVRVLSQPTLSAEPVNEGTTAVL